MDRGHINLFPNKAVVIWRLCLKCLTFGLVCYYLGSMGVETKLFSQTRSKMQLRCFNLFNFFGGNGFHMSGSFHILSDVGVVNQVHVFYNDHGQIARCGLKINYHGFFVFAVSGHFLEGLVSVILFRKIIGFGLVLGSL